MAGAVANFTEVFYFCGGAVMFIYHLWTKLNVSQENVWLELVLHHQVTDILLSSSFYAILY